MSDLNHTNQDRARDDDRLDDLIRRAVPCEIDQGSLARLAQVWNNEIAFAWRRRSWWLPLAAAACSGLLAGTLILFMAWPRHIVQDGNPSASPHIHRAPEPPAEEETVPEQTIGPEPNESADEPRSVNEPTPYERLLIHMALRGPGAATEPPQRSIRRDLIELIASLETVDDQTAAAVAAQIGVDMTRLEKELGPLCLVLRGPRQQKAVKLLSQIATVGSLDILLQLWPHAAHQRQIASAVARLANAETLATCFVQAGTADVRRVLGESLVTKLRPENVHLLFEPANVQQSAELTAALRNADPAVIEALFAQLDAEKPATRYAAARVLSGLNEPGITQRLIEFVVMGHRRQEALAALAASEEPAAVQFVTQLKRHAVWATVLQSAQVRFGTSHSWYGG